jgi:hypothetical protein
MSPARKTPARKAAAKKSTARKAPARKSARKSVPRATPARRHGTRADLGAPVDGFFARQSDPLRALLDELRRMILAAAPEATASLKWGMPFFEVRGSMMCALGAHRAHVNLILPGKPGTYDDPRGLLAGEGKTGRHLKLAGLAELPRREVKGWLTTAAGRARRGLGMR